MLSKFKTRIIFAVSTIVLCIVLLVSTTWSLFTAEDSVGVRVTAGDMDLGLFQADKNGKYVDIENAPEHYDVFGNFVWEPNATQVVFFKIVNNSNIPIKYTFQMDIENKNFSDAFEYVAFESEYFDVKGMNWDSLQGERTSQTLIYGKNPLSGNEYIPMQPGGVAYYAVAVHMKHDAGNRHQDVGTEFDVAVFAIQGNYS